MTRVALLWHMHQPFYQDLATGEHVMPWVRLHALKDYWGMVALLREFPSVRVTFNLVPSLLVQLEAFARDEARDRHLEIGLKPAATLSDEERTFCLEQFFHAHRPRMIDPYPRYAELLARRDLDRPVDGAPPRTDRFSVDDFRDLQVWHKLVWIDHEYWQHDPRIRSLVAKERRFTEEDKAVLRAVELELLRRVVPEYRDAVGRGQIEISTSPFYHAILPLLCDTDVYHRTHPYSRMPREPFRRPEDAAAQLNRAVALHQQLFGKRPVGLWPSEGSVSDAILPLVSKAGFRWMATDEAILARSLDRHLSREADGHVQQPELLYRSYSVGTDGQHVACGFRDHLLSDLIGFTYASWPADSAADDFVGRLAEAGRRYAARTGGESATIFVILDGENAWEHFEGQGRPFLRALYQRLASHPDLRTVTMGEACAPGGVSLPSVFPGSWINADFYIWIGHPDDHLAWSQLADARRALDAASGVPAHALARAWEEMLIAEGSDWFWWYGDDHSSNHDRTFDALFRKHVANIYQAIGVPVPAELASSNISTEPPPRDVLEPTGLITPIIDGRRTSYFEWLGAGGVETLHAGDAMHEVARHDTRLTSIAFGVDAEHLYLKVEGSRRFHELLADGFAVHVQFLAPDSRQLIVSGRDGKTTGSFVAASNTGRSPADAGVQSAAWDSVELRVPFGCVSATAGSVVSFVVAFVRGGVTLEQHPRHGPIEVAVPSGDGLGNRHWSV